MAKYFLGTEGWIFDESSHAKDHLVYYSNEASVVEITESTHEMPEESSVHEWYSRTPEDFCFIAIMMANIVRQSGTWKYDPDLLKNFLNTVSNLRNKLRYVLLQMPPSFVRTSPNSQFIRKFIRACNTLCDAKLAVEFRHSSWFTEETYRDLQDCIVVATPFIHVTLSKQLVMHLENLGQDIYIRLRSDEQTAAKQRDRRVEISTLVDVLKAFDNRLREVYIIVSKEFSGNAQRDAEKIHNELERRGLSAEGFPPRLSLS